MCVSFCVCVYVRVINWVLAFACVRFLCVFSFVYLCVRFKYVSMYLLVRAFLCLCVCVLVYVYMSICVYVLACLRVCSYMYVCASVCL